MALGAFGLLMTLAWLAFAFWYVSEAVGFENLLLLLPQEIALFVIGVVLPLGVLWFILAFFRFGRSFGREESESRASLAGMIPLATAAAPVQSQPEVLASAQPQAPVQPQTPTPMQAPAPAQAPAPTQAKTQTQPPAPEPVETSSWLSQDDRQPDDLLANVDARVSEPAARPPREPLSAGPATDEPPAESRSSRSAKASSETAEDDGSATAGGRRPFLSRLRKSAATRRESETALPEAPPSPISELPPLPPEEAAASPQARPVLKPEVEAERQSAPQTESRSERPATEPSNEGPPRIEDDPLPVSTPSRFESSAPEAPAEQAPVREATRPRPADAATPATAPAATSPAPTSPAPTSSATTAPSSTAEAPSRTESSKATAAAPPPKSTAPAGDRDGLSGLADEPQDSQGEPFLAIKLGAGATTAKGAGSGKEPASAPAAAGPGPAPTRTPENAAAPTSPAARSPQKDASQPDAAKAGSVQTRTVAATSDQAASAEPNDAPAAPASAATENEVRAAEPRSAETRPPRLPPDDEDSAPPKLTPAAAPAAPTQAPGPSQSPSARRSDETPAVGQPAETPPAAAASAPAPAAERAAAPVQPPVQAPAPAQAPASPPKSGRPIGFRHLVRITSLELNALAMDMTSILCESKAHADTAKRYDGGERDAFFDLLIRKLDADPPAEAHGRLVERGAAELLTSYKEKFDRLLEESKRIDASGALGRSLETMAIGRLNNKLDALRQPGATAPPASRQA